MLSEKSTPSIHLAPIPFDSIPVEAASPPASIELRGSIDTRVLLAVSVAQDTESSVTDWINWLNTIKAPAEILNINVRIENVRIESAYKSHSTLFLLSVPTLLWSRMVNREAYNFIGFVKSENLLRKWEVQDLDATKKKQSESQLGSRNLNIDESVDSKRNPLAGSSSDSEYEGESDERDYYDYSDYPTMSPHRYRGSSRPQYSYSTQYMSPVRTRYRSPIRNRSPSPRSPIRNRSPIPPRYRSFHSHRYHSPIRPPLPYVSTIPSARHEIPMPAYLRVTSFHDIADEVNQPFENPGFREALEDIYTYFEDMSNGEKMRALLDLLERCTKEQQDFIRELLGMETPGSNSIWGKFDKLLHTRV